MLDSDDALSAELIQQGNICGALNNWKKKKKKKRRSGLNQQALSPTLLSRPLSLFSARDRQKEKKKKKPAGKVSRFQWKLYKGETVPASEDGQLRMHCEGRLHSETLALYL